MAITSNPAVQNGAVSTGTGTHSFLNITATTAIKSTSGRVVAVNVIVAGSAAGAVFDHPTTSGIDNSNCVAVVPEAIGTYFFNFPCSTGITVVPPTGATISVSFN